MRVADLIPSRQARGSEPAWRGTGDPVGILQTEVNRAFDDFLRFLSTPLSGWQEAVFEAGKAIKADVAQSDKAIKITAELPGLDESDIDIRIGGGMLTIAGEKKVDVEANEQGYTLRERGFGRIERTLPLPEGIDADRAQATFKNGVLTVTIPKNLPAQSEIKRIPVTAN